MADEQNAAKTTDDDVASGSATENQADFETAIAACGIGYFNVCLVIASMSIAISVLFTTSSLSFVLPIAECDLRLSIMDKGYLNAMSFAGMLVSAIPWGYIADTMGRKIVLVYALILNGIIVLCSGISQSVEQLLIFKFIDGFLICGPFAVVMSYVSEFHGSKHRTPVLMLVGMNFSAASVILPIMAVYILPHDIDIYIGNFELHTWNIFLLATAIVPLLGGIVNVFFPESPKFLMTQGRNDDALKTLRTVYAVNQRKPKSEYPIKFLIDEDPEKTMQYRRRSSEVYKAAHKKLSAKTREAKNQFIEGVHQLRPMCSSPYLKLSIQIFTMFFSILLSLNSIRLWLPQIFITLREFEAKRMDSSSMCTVLQYNYNKTIMERKFHKDPNCDVVHISMGSYSDNIIVALSSFCVYLLATVFIYKLSSHVVLKICLFLSFFSGISLYFSNSRLMFLMLSSAFVSVICVAGTTVVAATVNLFPTKMRTMVIIMTMTFGRCGSLLGNVLFPLFISIGCVFPFILIGVVTAVAFVLAVFLPDASHSALK